MNDMNDDIFDIDFEALGISDEERGENVRQERLMTQDEVAEIIRAKRENLAYIERNMGIWGSPYGSERDSLKYWQDVQSGREPMPMVEVK